MSRRTGPSDATRHMVIERDQYVCRRCGRPGQSIHHRTPRGMGGTKDPAINLPSNLVLVCGHGTAGCHGDIESNRADSYLSGWLVHREEDPATVPLVDLSGIAWCLTDDGLAVPAYRRAS